MCAIRERQWGHYHQTRTTGADKPATVPTSATIGLRGPKTGNRIPTKMFAPATTKIPCHNTPTTTDKTPPTIITTYARPCTREKSPAKPSTDRPCPRIRVARVRDGRPTKSGGDGEHR